MATAAFACLLAGLPAIPAAQALPPDKALADYVAESWGVEEGLPQISVLAIAQDRDGYLWFGSQGGLSRYDGTRFTRFGHPDAPELGGHVLALHGGADGRVWIGTSQGLLRYADGRFRPVPLADDEDRVREPFTVRAIAAAGDGGVLVAGPDGVYAGDDQALTLRHPLPGPGLDLLRDDDGLWVASIGRVFRIVGDEVSVHPLPTRASQAQVSRLAVDGDGRLWAGTPVGLFRFGNGYWRHMSNTPVDALLVDRDGNLWVAGPQRLDRLRDGRFVESVVDRRGIRAIHEDRDGSLWLGSVNEGVTRFWDGWSTRVGREQGLRDPLLWSVARGPDGKIWVGGNDGVDVFDGRRFRMRVPGWRLPHPEAYSLLVERDRTWIGTRAGAAVLRNGLVETPRALLPLRNSQVNGIVRDRAGRLWFATNDGLFQLGTDGRLRRYGSAEGLPDVPVRLLHETRDGRLLIGTNRGLYEWREDGIVATGRRTGLEDDLMITAMHELDDGRWVIGSATGEDLWLYDGQHWTRLGLEWGVPANAAFHIASANDHLWVAGTRGVYRLPLVDLGEPGRAPSARVHAEIVINSGADRPGGQPGKCCNGAGNSRGVLVDDTLWLPTRDGAMLVDTARRESDGAEEPPVLIERAQVDGEWIHPVRGQPIVLPRHARDVRIDFTKPSFRRMRPTRLRYRLDGYDADWRDPVEASARHAAYANLPPGEYRFEVADFAAPDPFAETAGVDLSIPRRWHETLAFRLLLPLLLAGTAWLGFAWLQRRHLRQRSLLEQLVQARTQDLQNANARLEALSFTDPLTGLHNRRYLSRQIPADLSFYGRDAAYRSGDDAVVFALLDVDHFKAINDTHGHAAGDSVLAQLGALLRDLVRKGDYVARWGGEEFLLVLRPQPRGGLALLGTRLCEAIASHAFELDDLTRRRLTVSVGLVEHPLFPDTPELLGWEQMVTLADRALYRAKSSGRNTWTAYRPHPGARLPEGTRHVAGDPSWLVEQGLLEAFGPVPTDDDDAS